MGRRTGPLSLILALFVLLFLTSFVLAQAPGTAPAPAAVPKPAPPKKKAPAKAKVAKAKAKAKVAKAKGGKAKTKVKAPKAADKAVPAGPPPAPATAPPAPVTPPPTTDTDPNLAKSCTECWNKKRSELLACKGVTNDEFIGFSKDPSSAKVASCYCMFANNIKTILEDTCSAFCVDQTVVDGVVNQATQFKNSYKCDDKGNTILGSSNLVADNKTSSATSSNVNKNNMYLGLSSFVVGIISFLILNLM